MKYTEFVRFTTELHEKGAASLFLSGFTISAKRKNTTWEVQTKILIADRAECERLLEVIPVVEKLRLERARVSLYYANGGIVLSGEIPATSRFLAVRHALQYYLLLARFWQEELSPLTLLASQ